MSTDQLAEIKLRLFHCQQHGPGAVWLIESPKDIALLIEEVEWRTKHMAESDKELNQIGDWLIGNAEIDPKTGLIDRAAKLKERIRDLIAAEAELADSRDEARNNAIERDLNT